MKFSLEYFLVKLSLKRPFRENWRIWISTCTSPISWIICVKFGTGNLCIMQFWRSEFPETICSEKKKYFTLGCKWIFVPIVSIYLPIKKKLCKPDAHIKLLPGCEFCKNRHIENYIWLRSAKECMATLPNLLSYMV
jgi:hypothetical protein